MYECPKCNSEYGYDDGVAYNCPECGHIWTDLCIEKEKEKQIVRDSVGNELQDGDDVSIIKDLKMGSTTLKRGMKAQKIQLIEEIDGHDLEARISGVGRVYLKSEFVKKL
ncbi:MAG: zinc ribbon domain-containing protein YjdM [Tissierellia bacterium]|nr:zinc ribbon domain-containing protein YjdM [Tissierellia bacterium]